MAKILVCDCGECKHWEILSDRIKCVSCGEAYPLQTVMPSAQGQIFPGLDAGRSASFQEVAE